MANIRLPFSTFSSILYIPFLLLTKRVVSRQSFPLSLPKDKSYSLPQTQRIRVPDQARTESDRPIGWTLLALAVGPPVSKVEQRANGASREQIAVQIARSAYTIRGSLGIHYSFSIPRILRRLMVDCCAILPRKARRPVVIFHRPRPRRLRAVGSPRNRGSGLWPTWRAKTVNSRVLHRPR